jgi:hypothetical protein
MALVLLASHLATKDVGPGDGYRRSIARTLDGDDHVIPAP